MTSLDPDIVMDGQEFSARTDNPSPSFSLSQKAVKFSMIYDFKIPGLAHRKNLYSSSVNTSPKMSQNAKEDVTKVLAMKMK